MHPSVRDYQSTAELPPIFIVGMHGSGTTMLLDHLNSHSMLFGFRLETKILPYFLEQQHKFGDLTNDRHFLRLFNEMRSSFPMRKVNAGHPVPLPDFWQQMPRTVSAVFDYLMSYFARQESKTRWCEKSPLHVLHMIDISRAFGGAQFVHVIRDGRDCAASFHRRWRYDPASTIQMWKTWVRTGQEQGRSLGPNEYYEVRYERLTSNASTELSGICDFLHVPFEPAILSSSRSAARVQGIDSRTIIRTDRGFATYFDSPTIERLELIAGSTLHKLGYTTRFPSSDLDIPELKLRFLRVRDQLRLGLTRALQNVASRKKLPWGMVWQRLQRALRYRRDS